MSDLSTSRDNRRKPQIARRKTSNDDCLAQSSPLDSSLSHTIEFGGSSPSDPALVVKSRSSVNRTRSRLATISPQGGKRNHISRSQHRRSDQHRRGSLQHKTHHFLGTGNTIRNRPHRPFSPHKPASTPSTEVLFISLITAGLNTRDKRFISRSSTLTNPISRSEFRRERSP